MNNKMKILDLGKMDYKPSWDFQKNFQQDVLSGKENDTLNLVEHEPVYTLGKNANKEHLLDKSNSRVKVYNVERGGDITFHGPGQLVGYPILNLNNFRTFVDLFYKNREALLHTQLYNSVKLISFKEGEVFLNTSSIKDQNFNRNVAKLVSKWTGRIWQIHSSDSNIGSSLSEEDIIDQQNEIKIMKNQPEVKKILDALPGLSIHSITDITETVDETIDEFKQENHKEV